MKKQAISRLSLIRAFRRLRLWVRITIVVVLLGVAFMVTAIEITGTTRFCNSCHIMNDYYASWQHSDHNEVNCLMCHTRPGLTGYVKAKMNGLSQALDCAVGRVGTKPNGHVSDSSCLRGGCHTTDELNGDSLNFNGVRFSHSKHIEKVVDGITLQCGTCHSHFEGEAHFSVNTDVCYTCHFLEESADKGRLVNTKCQSCHDVPNRVIKQGLVTINHAEFVSYQASCEDSCHRNEIRIPSQVADNVCLNCHSERLERPVDSAELHAQHNADHGKVECFACHGEVIHSQAGTASVAAMMDCESCHSDAHHVQQTIYTTQHPLHHDTGDRVLSPMFLTHVECTGCHIERRARTPGVLDSFGTVARAVPVACDRCHEPGTGEQYVPYWQKQIKGMHARVSDRLARVVQRTNAEGREQDLQRARAILDSITADGSWGVHNFKYTEGLLQEADRLLAGAERAPGERGGAL